MEKIRLLLTCVGGFTVPSLLKSLSNSTFFSYYFVGVDSRSPEKSEELLDGYYQVPNGSDDEYFEKILEIIRNEDIQYILPLSDEEAVCIARHRQELDSIGVKPIVSDIETLELITNKYDTYLELEKKGVRVPQYTIVQTTDELRSAINEYDYPNNTVISKPINGRGGRGLNVFSGNDSPPNWLGQGQRERIIRESDINENLLKNIMKDICLVMPALKTPTYDADVLANDGLVRTVVVRERVNPAGIPFEGNRLHSDIAIAEYCEDIALALSLNSIHDIDLMTDHNGDPCVIEVNPRASGSIAASLVAGIPIIDTAIASLNGRTFPSKRIVSDVMILSSNGELELYYE